MRNRSNRRARSLAAFIVLAIFLDAAGAQAATAVTHTKAAGKAAACPHVRDLHRQQVDAKKGKTKDACAQAKQPKLRQVRTSDIAYPNRDRSVRRDVDLDRFENIFGHLDAKDSAVDWPGRPGAVSTILALPQSGFVCARFTVPKGARYFGSSGVGSYHGQAVDIAYSDKCGDFAPKQANCATDDIGMGESGPRWATVAGIKGCLLKPGVHYWNARTHERGNGSATVTFTNTFASTDRVRGAPSAPVRRGGRPAG